MELSFGMPRFMFQSYFIQPAVIKGVTVNYDSEVFGIVWDVELSLRLDITKRNGKSFEYTLNVRVNYTKDDEGNIIGWGSAFKISRIFEVLQLNGRLEENGCIPDNCLQQLIGKDIFVLSYRTGYKEDSSPKFQMWDVIDVSKESLMKAFLNSIEKGYPKNFAPASLRGEETHNVVGKQVDSKTIKQQSYSDEDDYIF